MGRPERTRDMNLASSESGVDKWERRGPLPQSEQSERRQQRGSGMGSRSSSGQFGNAANRPPQHESSVADTNEWRSSKPLAPLRSPENRNSPVIKTSLTDLETSPPASPSIGSPPVAQRKKLTLLPRSEHPQEPTPTPQAAVEETHSTRSNPFGAARPVDTDSALKKLEEKLAREKLKEHKEESAPAKRATSPNTQSNPTTGPRHEKPRAHPKQLLRRTPQNASTGPNSPPVTSGTGDFPAENSEGGNTESAGVSDGAEASWRAKPEVDAAPPPPPPADEEPGWETVPARGKKINGVGVRH